MLGFQWFCGGVAAGALVFIGQVLLVLVFATFEVVGDHPFSSLADAYDTLQGRFLESSLGLFGPLAVFVPMGETAMPVYILTIFILRDKVSWRGYWRDFPAVAHPTAVAVGYRGIHFPGLAYITVVGVVYWGCLALLLCRRWWTLACAICVLYMLYRGRGDVSSRLLPPAGYRWVGMITCCLGIGAGSLVGVVGWLWWWWIVGSPLI